MKKSPQRLTLKIDGTTRLVLTAERITISSTTGMVLLKCPKCGDMMHLGRFGMRRMPSGQMRNQPQCKSCR
jgi:hypothetical protein